MWEWNCKKKLENEIVKKKINSKNDLKQNKY
jgi:hypothetical protein